MHSRPEVIGGKRTEWVALTLPWPPEALGAGAPEASFVEADDSFQYAIARRQGRKADRGQAPSRPSPCRLTPVSP